MKNIEQKANKIIEELNLVVPISVKDIAKKYNVQIKKSPSEDFSGVLFKKEDIAFMAINTKESPVRQRFTIAHELGHFFLHANESTFVEFRDNGTTQPRNQMEVEANQFAAMLLMPAHFLEKDVEALNVQNITAREISVLATKYNVSQDAMTFRLLNLRLS